MSSTGLVEPPRPTAAEVAAELAEHVAFVIEALQPHGEELGWLGRPVDAGA